MYTWCKLPDIGIVDINGDRVHWHGCRMPQPLHSASLTLPGYSVEQLISLVEEFEEC